jgi:hypothetical protein
MPIVEVPGHGDVEFPDDMSDDAIAAAIRKNMMPAKEPESYPGAGGYNPMQSMLGGSALRIGERLGMTPENTASPVRNALAPAEVALQLGTGAVAAPVAGLAGLGQGVKNLFSPGMQAGDRTRQIQESLTYQPRTGAGAGMSRASALPIEAYSAGTNYLGEKATDITGSPAVGATIKTLGDVAPAVIGGRNAPRPGPRRVGGYTPTKTEVPTTEQLRTAANLKYKEAKDSGVMVPADSYGKAVGEISEMARNEALNDKLHPKSSEVMRVLEKSREKDLTLQEAENLRKLALDAEGDVNSLGRQTADGRIAGKIVDELDDKIDALSLNNEARALWSRTSKSQLLDNLIERAENRAGANYTQAGKETALRQEFKSLLNNPRRMRGFTPEQKAAIKRVVHGGAVENTLRTLGKFDPTTGGMGTAISAGLAGGFAAPTGGMSLALPVIGFGAKRGATAMTARNVQAAREALVGRGLPSAAPQTRAAPTLPNAALPAAIGGPRVRSTATIRNEMQNLVRQASTAGKPGAASIQEVWLELQRLQAELKTAESREAAQRGPSGPRNQ